MSMSKLHRVGKLLNKIHKRSNYINKFYSEDINRAIPKLSPYDVNCILRANEYTHEYTQKCAVKSYDSNQLASNSPIEDTRSESSLIFTSGELFNISDGHGGASCAQVIAKRLPRYIAAALIPPDILTEQLNSQQSDNKLSSKKFLSCHNDKVEFVTEIRDMYEDNFFLYINDLIKNNNKNFNMQQVLENAFLRLDDDLSLEATEKANARTLSVAMSGAVSVLAHVDGAHLHVASTGDCNAVLGTVTDTGQWVTKKLTTEHNADNINELNRIYNEHPTVERDSIIKAERLLGQLAPLRAFGDYRYKWTKELLEKLAVPFYGEHSIPPNYYTPPYLTAKPDITHHILTPKDRFLILGSDGLWDLMSPNQVVKLIGEHMYGKAFLQPLKLPKEDVTLGTITKMLAHRKSGLLKKPLDRNGATHLIRNALGGTEYGIEHSKLSHMLSLPQDIVRLFRDDITITVIYFDPEFLRHCPT